MEIWYGVWRLPLGQRREILEAKAQYLIGNAFGDRVTAFDASSAETCGRLLSENWRNVRNTKTQDVQIAAIAITRGWVLATRNVRDFVYDGLQVVNPWAN